MSVGQRVDYMSKGFSLMSVLGLSDTKGVLNGMLETYGSINALSKSQVDSVGRLAKQMGISGKEAFGMVDAFSKMPGETLKTAINTAKYVDSLSKANGIAPGKIARDIAKNTEAMALFGNQGAKEFAKSAVELHKMGIEISTASKMAQGLLNFEDSINKQLEASVLLGREVNFDKAREYALQGKLADAAKEVVKQAGGEAEWGRMNVLQKQKLAQAAGMTVEEMQKQIDAQKEFNKYHGPAVSGFKNMVGYAIEYGSAGVKFMKENATALLATLQLTSQLGGKKLAQIVIDKAQLAWQKMASLWRSADAAKEMAEDNQKIGSKKRLELANRMSMLSGGGGGMMGGLNAASLIKGAAAMAIAAVGIFIFAKAVQELDKVKSWSNVAKGLALFAGSMAVLGAIAYFAATPLLMVSPALLAFGAAVLLFGLGLRLAVPGMEAFGNLLPIIGKNVGAFLLLGPGLMLIAAGLAAIAVAGIAALPILAAISGLALVAPAVIGIGTAIGGMFGGGGKKKEEDSMVQEIRSLKAEVSGLRKDIKTVMKGDVVMDGYKVGEVLRLALNMGVK
jgi:hypothetical protein